MTKTQQKPRMGDRLSLKTRITLTGWAFILPNFIGFFIFILIPVIASFGLSFVNWNGRGDFSFAGIQHYLYIFKDSTFRISLKNTFVYVFFNVIFTIALSLAVALLLNQKIRGRNFFRAIAFFPYMISGVATATIWGMLLQKDMGLVNSFLKTLGFTNVPAWFASTKTSMASVILVTVWKNFGYYMVIFLAGLQSVPGELYEAATMDGATEWQKTLRITLPLLNHTSYLVLMLLIISSFQVFDIIFLMTEGGPGRSTTVLSQYIYNQAFNYWDYGRASAAAVVLFLIVATLTILQTKFEKKDY